MPDSLNQEAIESLRAMCSQINKVQKSFHSMKHKMINVHDKVRMATELYRFKQNRNYENVDPDTIQVFDSEDEDLAPATILETIDTAKYRIVDVQEKLYRLKESFNGIIKNIKRFQKFNAIENPKGSVKEDIGVPSVSGANQPVFAHNLTMLLEQNEVNTNE